MRPPRLGLSGSAGTGKSTLGRALAAALDVPYLPEGMRSRLEAGLGTPLVVPRFPTKHSLHSSTIQDFTLGGAMLIYRRQLLAQEDRLSSSMDFCGARYTTCDTLYCE